MYRWLLPIALTVPSLAAAEETLYPGYRWHALDNGVYVHAQADPLFGPVDGNSTVIVGDDTILVVDTHINPAVTRAVISKIRNTWDLPVAHVVNTHWHDDHTNGNDAYRQAFPDVKIVASRATSEALAVEWQAMEDQRRESYRSIDVAELRAEADALEERDPDTAISYRVYAGYVEALRPELPTMALEFPDTLIEGELILDIGGRDVHVRPVGSGNTAGDVIVWVPDSKLLVAGDIVVAPVPFAFSSPMVAWIDTLDALSRLGAETIVPGHGTVQRDAGYLIKLRELLDFTVDAVRQAYERGASYEEIANEVDLSAFERSFAGNDREARWAWRAYFAVPGAQSAWVALGYPVPQEND